MTELFSKIQEEFYNEEEQLFINKFYKYLKYDENDFIIDLDDVYEWIGYSSKQKAIDLLIKEFEENFDYKAENNDKYYMTILSFGDFCRASHTPSAKQTRKYLKKMMNIMKEYEKEQNLELLAYKEKTYEEIQKTGSVYALLIDNRIKVGYTTGPVKARVQALQTGNVNDIEILMDFPTSNPQLLERIVHYALDRYRSNSNREFFDCNIEHIRRITYLCGTVLDTAKSCYQNITDNEVDVQLKEKNLSITFPQSTNMKHVSQIEERYVDNIMKKFSQWLDDNIALSTIENEILELKMVCEAFTGKQNLPSRITTKYKVAMENYFKKRFQNINHEYGQMWINGGKMRGWRFLKLRNGATSPFDGPSEF